MMKTDTTVVRFSHFGAFAEGSALPARYAGQLFAIDPLHNEVIASERYRRGATFGTADHGPVVKSSDPSFRPVFIANAPDGSLLVADFYDYYIAHGQHYQNQIDPTTGRIYRLSGRDAKRETDLDLATKTTDQLVALLGHSNKWHRHTAVRVLGERKDPQAAPRIKAMLAKDAGLGALNALWALHQSAGLDEATALKALQHPYAPVRMWTVRLLGDDHGIHRGLGSAGGSPASSSTETHGRAARARTAAAALPARLFAPLTAQARIETDPEVLSQFAATARRFEARQALPLVAAVLAHDEAVSDPYIPLLCWWVFEALIPAASDDVLALFRPPALWDKPMVFEHILPRLARRFAVEGRRPDLLRCAELFRAAPSSKHAAQLMKGFEEGFRGRAMTGLPEELVAAITASGRAPLIFRVKQGDAAAVAEALQVAQDPKAKLEDRLLYTRVFSEVRHDRAVPVLLALAAEDKSATLRKAALGTLSVYDEAAIGPQVLGMLAQLPAEVRSAALALLGSRTRWAQALLEALQSGRVPLSIVPPDIADRLRSHRDQSVSAPASKLFPKGESAGEFQGRIAAVETALSRGAGNPYTGETIFLERCATCHKLFFKGGNIGPELTNYQRDNLGTLLVSILNPNAEIREGFEYLEVETVDERSLSGFLVERDTQVTILRGLDGQDHTLRQSEIKEVRAVGRSLMPEGLLEGLDERQLRDFFAYLRISQPITK
jgi:putative heme-binding domain-containing protein